MKKLLLSALITAALGVTATGCKIYVNGSSDSDDRNSTEEVVSQNLTSKMLDVTSVSKIDASGVVSVIYVQDVNVSAEMVAPDNMLDKYSYKLVDGKLKVWKNKDGQKVNGKIPSLKLIVHSPSLTSVTLSGVSSFVTKTLTSSGSDVKFNLSGASNATISDIAADGIKIDASGASAFKCANVNVANISIDCSGASNAEMNVADAQEVDVDCSGASTVTLAGKAERVSYDCSGASSIKAGKLVAQAGSSHSSGVSSIKSNIKSNK